MDHESVQATALKTVFDLLHVFGFEAFNMGADPSKLHKEINEVPVYTSYVHLCKFTQCCKCASSLIVSYTGHVGGASRVQSLCPARSRN